MLCIDCFRELSFDEWTPALTILKILELILKLLRHPDEQTCTNRLMQHKSLDVS